MGGGGGFRGGGGGGGFRGGGGGRRSDIALKHDVVLLGHLANGLGYYRFSYLGSTKPYVGVIAQEVQSLMPEAVTRGRDGYLRVDYEQLGLKFGSYTDWLAGGARIPDATGGPAMIICKSFCRITLTGPRHNRGSGAADFGILRRSRPIPRRRTLRRLWLQRSRPAPRALF